MINENIGEDIPIGRKIICIDFDGVIHSYKSKWQGIDKIPDKPVPGAFEWLRRLCNHDDYSVCIYSSRSRELNGITAMKNWFINHGMEKEFVSIMHFPTKKPAAYLTLDDRAIQFTGVFPSIGKIENFKPWYCKNVKENIMIVNGYNIKQFAYLEGADLEGADLKGADLKGARLEGANLKGADLEGADLKSANFKGAYLEGAYLGGAYLEGANIEGANLECANLEGANLECANLEDAYLGGANLKGACLEGACLEDACLEGACLEGADLEGACLEGADLEGADLEGANLKGADLEGAYLKGAYLKGANIEWLKI